MLTRLYIQNYALIDSLDISFPGNLVVISGETGAGKSILLGALSLLLGRKADASVLGDPSRNCVVEAEFEDAGEQTILRRVVSPQGRSRSFVNDEPVPLDELKQISATLVDLHSQFDHIMLSSSKYQLSVLDAFAGISDDVAAYRELYGSWCATGRKIAELQALSAKSESDRDYLQYQFDQLDAARLAEGEQEELEAEQNQLANSGEISEQLAVASALFDADDCSIGSQLRALESALDKVARFIPEAGALRERVESARIDLKDVDYELSSLGDKVRFSSERLQEVDDRLALLYDLMRKHSVQSVAELIAVRDDISARLGQGLDMEGQLESLRSEYAALRGKCTAAADALHNARLGAAAKLADELQQSVRSLEMPLALFEVKLDTLAEPGPDGMDEVAFLFSANKGSAPKELSKCASGGELSRIMLCIKALVSRYMGMPTMIFDEIDTGVSGSVAYRMGEMIVSMGEHMQVMAITHLPQVASRGNAHFLVYKDIASDGRTHSAIRRLEGKERELEIARMLSGATITEEALANARSLIDNANL